MDRGKSRESRADHGAQDGEKVELTTAARPRRRRLRALGRASAFLVVGLLLVPVGVAALPASTSHEPDADLLLGEEDLPDEGAHPPVEVGIEGGVMDGWDEGRNDDTDSGQRDGRGDGPGRDGPRSASPVVRDLAGSGIPEVALKAYQRAADAMERVDPGCGLQWWLLAAIGRVESDHGRYGGAELQADGYGTRPIRGIPLDGRTGVALIRDTDGGALDGDAVYDRAVGPMQFIPSSWAAVAADGNGDGDADPNNIFDAAMGAAVYLCAGDADLTTVAGREQAVFRYNHSWEYVRTVLALAAAYASGDVEPLPSVPGSGPPVADPRTLDEPPRDPATAGPPPGLEDTGSRGSGSGSGGSNQRPRSTTTSTTQPRRTTTTTTQRTTTTAPTTTAPPATTTTTARPGTTTTTAPEQPCPPDGSTTTTTSGSSSSTTTSSTTTTTTTTTTAPSSTTTTTTVPGDGDDPCPQPDGPDAPDGEGSGAPDGGGGGQTAGTAVALVLPTAVIALVARLRRAARSRQALSR